MADKAALPGLAPAEDEVFDFGSSAVEGEKSSNSEPDDTFPAHTHLNDGEEGKIIDLPPPSLPPETTLTHLSRGNDLGEHVVLQRGLGS